MTKNKRQIYLLRTIHGLFALYFIVCVLYLFYAAVSARFDKFLVIALISLALEGFVVFILNKGDCPLIHVQRKIKDDVPFFELFLPKKLAKKAIPFFSTLTIIALMLLLMRYSFY